MERHRSRLRESFASFRHIDTFVKAEGEGLFAERRLCVDRLEERTRS